MFYLILFVISNFCFVAKDEDQAHYVTQKTQLEDEEKKNKSQNAFSHAVLTALSANIVLQILLAL